MSTSRAIPRGTLSFNINAYIDSWAKQNSGFGRDRFLQAISQTLNRLIETLDIDILYVVTQVMDTPITQESLKGVQRRDRIHLVSNADYTYQEIAGLLQRADLHVGMRTHSLILAAAVGTPMVAINSYPKTAGFMKTIGQDDRVIYFDQLSTDALTVAVSQAWHDRDLIRAAMLPQIQREQAKARSSAALVTKLLSLSEQLEVSMVG